MRKLLLICCATMLLCGCKSKEEKAKEAIGKEIVKQLAVKNSYQPISTTVEDAYPSPESDSEFLLMVYDILDIRDQYRAVSSAQSELMHENNMTSFAPFDYEQKLFSNPQSITLLESQIYELHKNSGYLFDLLQAKEKGLKKKRNNNSNKKIGYKVKQVFQCMDLAGNTITDSVNCVFDDNFKEVLFFKFLNDPRYQEALEYYADL